MSNKPAKQPNMVCSLEGQLMLNHTVLHFVRMYINTGKNPGGCIPSNNPAADLPIFFMEMENYPHDV